jgi:hypothetical protein
MSTGPQPLPEISGVAAEDVHALIAGATEPLVFRGAVAHWPLVEAGIESREAVSNYLLGFYGGQPVPAFIGAGETGGRIFYTDDLADLNCRQVKVTLDEILAQINAHAGTPSPPTLYTGSLVIEQFLPGLVEAHRLLPAAANATIRLWLGNRTKVAAHYDVLDNLACVCAGRRRFTLFPPDQIRNLYVGPLDFTPAGQAVSLVDFDQPDFARHARYAEALEAARSAVLGPGDAIFIPSMWWHHVEGLDDLNLLLNHWWRDVPAYLGAPGDALLHAMLSIRDLPPTQREAWKQMFNHYVFSADSTTAEHIPLSRRGWLGPMDDEIARRLRTLLRNRLNR